MDPCGNCGRAMAKAHRVHHGVRYCTTCYAREFKRRLCPGCGEAVVLPSKEDGSECAKCVRSRPCVRCKRSGRRVGRLTDYGPVCNSCASYFRAEKPCGECNVPSRRLTSVRRLEVDVRVCPKCARRDFGTCSACRHHRLLAIGVHQKLCERCATKETTTCNECNRPMPAGRGQMCEECGWRKTLSKRMAINAAAFSNTDMAEAFADFGTWLVTTVGVHKAALSINRYASFFVETERLWQRFPDYADLVGHFGAEGLRRVRLPMRWLLHARGYVVDPKVRVESSEKRRIKEMLASLNERPQLADLANQYAITLCDRIERGSSSFASVRLALRPAVSLLSSIDEHVESVDQGAVDRYLKVSPGQRAALTGFIGFLNRAKGTMLHAKVDARRARRRRRNDLEKSLHRLALTPGGETTFQWSSTALRLFHGLTAKAAKMAVIEIESFQSIPGVRATINGSSYWVPTKEGYLRQFASATEIRDPPAMTSTEKTPTPDR